MASARARPLGLAMGPALALALAGPARPARADAQSTAHVERRLAEQPADALNLGTWGRPGAVTAESVLRDAPRFESTVNVEGRAPRDPNEAMAEWWRHFNLPEGSIYGQGLSYFPGQPVNAINI